MKDYNTRFAIMEMTKETIDFLRNGDQVALFTMREAKRIVEERKAPGRSYSLVPHVG